FPSPTKGREKGLVKSMLKKLIYNVFKMGYKTILNIMITAGVIKIKAKFSSDSGLRIIPLLYLENAFEACRL
ncbi:MAG TPA: hypothetical protein DDW93_04810, partial [Firmicutes bacterium]|nr:hypothetical protein [Bacillota bacterium]